MTLRQVWALARLRRQMVRSRGVRAGLGGLAVALPVLLALAVSAGRSAGPAGADTELLIPAVFAALAAVAVIGPLAMGGGYELFPSDQLVASPVRPATVVAGSALLSPLNLTWLVQLLGVAGATGYLAGPGPRLVLAAATTGAYVILAVLVGLVVSWSVVGLRARRTGRALVGATAVALAATTWTLVATGHGAGALEALPTSWVIDLVEEGSSGSPSRWATGFAVLGLGAAVAAGLAVRACGWALMRSVDRCAHGEGRPVRRRSPRRGPFRELVAVDRASVLRSVPLRRGILTLALVPGAAGAVAGVDWSSIVMLPGIVAAGTGLLFGINVFCLDSGGATWLSSLPQDPRLAYLAKARVLAEACGLTALTTVLLAACRAPAPTAGHLVGVVAALVVCPVVVVAICMSISVRRPHRADLRGPRDTPTPPGSMLVNSLLLSLTTTGAGAVLSIASYEAQPWVPTVVGLALAVPAAVALHRGAGRWREPARRARVVAAVSAG